MCFSFVLLSSFPNYTFKHKLKFVSFSHEINLIINILNICKLHLQPLQIYKIYLQDLQIYDLYMCKMAKNVHNFLILIFQ